MNSGERCKIDRSNEKEVDKYITSVFIYLKKYKTKDILNAYFTWYNSKPERVSIDVQEFDVIPRKNIEDFNKVNKKRTIDVAYGDKYAILLTKFVRANKSYETELIRIAQDLVVASKFENKKLGISKLLSSFDLILIKEVFKILKSVHGVVTVTQVPRNSARLISKREEVSKNDKDTSGQCYQTNMLKYEHSIKLISNKSVDHYEEGQIPEKFSFNVKSKISLGHLSILSNDYSGITNDQKKNNDHKNKCCIDNKKGGIDSLEDNDLEDDDIKIIKVVDMRKTKNHNDNKLTDINDLIDGISSFTINSGTVRISKHI